MKKYLVLLVVIALLVTGCAAPQNRTEEGTRKGAALGAIGGAVLGQVIGGNTQATLIGAGIGAVAGGAIGRSYGKKMDEQEAALRRQLAAIEAANIQRNADILAVTFRSDVLFDSGSATLKPGADNDIMAVSRVLNQYTETRIRVAGHTDSTGSATFNQQLSELRAANVKLALVNQGVHPSRIETVGFGQTAPLADNSSDTGRRLNRRVVITISPPQA
jgi:outer membrane protein OmpA-like peptidoglycan-associated protein